MNRLKKLGRVVVESPRTEESTDDESLIGVELDKVRVSICSEFVWTESIISDVSCAGRTVVVVLQVVPQIVS